MALNSRYPHNWYKVTRVLKRIAAYQCELCNQPVHSIHHVGAPRPTGDCWVFGNPRDKHDLRRENLLALCFSCHDRLDHGAVKRHAAKRVKDVKKNTRHRVMGVGTGLVPLRPVYVSWSSLAILYACLLKWSKRTGRTRYQLLSGPSPLHIVDSYLVTL